MLFVLLNKNEKIEIFLFSTLKWTHSKKGQHKNMEFVFVRI